MSNPLIIVNIIYIYFYNSRLIRLYRFLTLPLAPKFELITKNKRVNNVGGLLNNLICGLAQ